MKNSQKKLAIAEMYNILRDIKSTYGHRQWKEITKIRVAEMIVTMESVYPKLEERNAA